MRLVPGLLQTSDYARAVMMATAPFATVDEIESGVAERMARKAILERPEPPTLNVIVHECVVRQPVGDIRITKEQISHLISLADSRHVNIRVLPFAAGCMAGALGAFSIFEFEEQPLVGSVEGRGGGNLVDGEELRKMVCVYDQIGAAALTKDQSVGLLMGALDAAWLHTSR